MTTWSDPLGLAPTKFRIRVSNEEIALPVGVTLIGRDPSCRITIFDPLISRRHARVQCDGEQAVIEDLGSRNGTRVNRVLISSPHALRDGDRIGIGSYELVAAVVERDASELDDTPTGLLCICTDCKNGYPANYACCPHCGSTRTAAPTNPTRGEDTTRGRWSLGMLIEMLGKAILTERVNEAEKLMREIAIIVGTHLRDDKPFDQEELGAIGEAAAWLAKAQKSETWPSWLASVRAQLADRSWPSGAEPP